MALFRGRMRKPLTQFSMRDMLLLLVTAGVLFAWWSDHQRLTERLEEAEQMIASRPKPSWGCEQIIGPPDTAGPGDIVTAWASSTMDGQREWLLLDYGQPVVPAAVHIYETYNPGAVDKVSVFDPQGKEVVIFSGADPTPVGSGMGVSKIKAKVNFTTRRVKLYLNSPQVPGWNEIDAVGLIDTSGATQWAKYVKASSDYGQTVGASVPPAVPGPTTTFMPGTLPPQPGTQRPQKSLPYSNLPYSNADPLISGPR